MLRTIDILPDGEEMKCPPPERTIGASPHIIKRTTIARGLQANDILADAHARAATIIADAENDAAQIRAAGFRDGLQTGMLSALTPIVAMVSEWNKVKASLREDAENALRACVEDLASRDATLVALVEVICDAHAPVRSEKVHIKVPQGARVPILETRCRELNLDASIEVADAASNFSVSWRGHTWVAHLGEVAKEAWLSGGHLSAERPDLDAAVICRDALLDVAHTLVPDDGLNEKAD